MSKSRKALESWIEFVSPYQRLRRSIEQLVSELEQLDPDAVHELPVPVDASDTSERASLAKQWTASAQILNKAFGISFGIRSMLPVMAEASGGLATIVGNVSSIVAVDLDSATSRSGSMGLRHLHAHGGGANAAALASCRLLV